MTANAIESYKALMNFEFGNEAPTEDEIIGMIIEHERLAAKTRRGERGYREKLLAERYEIVLDAVRNTAMKSPAEITATRKG